MDDGTNASEPTTGDVPPDDSGGRLFGLRSLDDRRADLRRRHVYVSIVLVVLVAARWHLGGESPTRVELVACVTWLGYLAVVESIGWALDATRDTPSHLRFEDDGVVIERWGGWFTTRIPFDRLVEVLRSSVFGRDSLTLAWARRSSLLPGGTTVVPASWLTDGTLDDLETELRAHLDAHVPDRNVVFGTSHQPNWTLAPGAWPWLTATTLALVAATYRLQQWQTSPVEGLFQDVWLRLEQGAPLAGLTLQPDQWFRAIAHSTIHADGYHLACNLLALAIVGTCLEWCTDRWQWSLAVFAAATFAGLATLGSPGIAYGSSTLVFALYGALAVTWWRMRRRWPGWLRGFLLLLFGISLANTLVGLSGWGASVSWWGRTSYEAHAAGLLVGGYTILVTSPRLVAGSSSSGARHRSVPYATCLLGLVCAVGLGWTGWYRATGPHFEDHHWVVEHPPALGLVDLEGLDGPLAEHAELISRRERFEAVRMQLASSLARRVAFTEGVELEDVSRARSAFESYVAGRELTSEERSTRARLFALDALLGDDSTRSAKLQRAVDLQRQVLLERAEHRDDESDEMRRAVEQTIQILERCDEACRGSLLEQCGESCRSEPMPDWRDRLVLALAVGRDDGGDEVGAWRCGRSRADAPDAIEASDLPGVDSVRDAWQLELARGEACGLIGTEWSVVSTNESRLPPLP